MHPQPSSLWNTAQVRAIDAFAISTTKIPGFELMHRAASAALDELRRRWPRANRILVVCGSGNNGGDGYVLASLARAVGLESRVAAVSDPKTLRGDAALAFSEWQAIGGQTLPWSQAFEAPADVVVDALLGIGASRELEGEYLTAVNRVNAGPAPVLALDIPSGLHADTGLPLGICVHADCTVTFIAHKMGLWLAQGPDFSGEIVLADLGLSVWPDNIGAAPLLSLQTAELRASIKPRPRGANKGQFGHVLVIGGGPGMPGAARLCGEAALRSGAGLVSIATAPEHAAHVASMRPELMVSGVAAPDGLMPLLARADVVAIGPGLGQSAWARAIWSCAMASGKPMVVDADALNLLAAQPETREDWILTPHPGEAGRLLGISTQGVQDDRVAAVKALQSRFGGTVILKGAGSMVAGTGEPLRVCLQGNPGMAAAGMGDVLTGVVAGLQGQVRQLNLAARLGVLVHALAGDRAALKGQRGLIASDLIAELRGCLNPP
jgi:ADP-dependent NAD(P)H-hydrate dehydratase / NAD(P)H-hydrate epimerase